MITISSSVNNLKKACPPAPYNKVKARERPIPQPNSRRNSHPSHASRHDSGIGMLLPYLLRIQGYNGEPCTVDGIYHLLTASRCVTRCVGEKNFRLLFFSAKAASQVIIDKTRSLQVSITNRRSKELKASFFHIPAHGIGLGRRHRNLT